MLLARIAIGLTIMGLVALAIKIVVDRFFFGGKIK